jgi:hypothetical protein
MLNNLTIRKALWLSLAVIALLGTWAQILGYLELSFWGAQVAFWRDTLGHPVTRFITLDVLFLSTVVVFWMLTEARRLAIPFVWVYVVYGVLVAISSAFPLFMYARERPRERKGEQEVVLTASDHLIFVLLLAVSVVHLVFALRAAQAG